MSTVVYHNKQLTLTEVAKRELNGAMLPVAEILSRTNEWLMDAVWLPANNKFTHVTAQRYVLPAGSYRKFNAGVASEMGQVRQIVDQIGMLESYAEHDVKLVNSMANPAQFRNDENAGFIEGMGQTTAYQFIYGNALVDPEKWTGLAPRMAALAATTNVIGAGGSGGDTTSIYIVQWGADKVHMVYPQGSAAGLQHQDLGEVTKEDSNGLKWQVYRDHFMWDCGLVVRNPRCIGRVANIEVSGSSNLLDEDYLIRILSRMYMGGKGAVLYANPSMKAQIDIIAKDKGNVWFTTTDAFGQPVTMFRGCPIRQMDAITDAETQIS